MELPAVPIFFTPQTNHLAHGKGMELVATATSGQRRNWLEGADEEELLSYKRHTRDDTGNKVWHFIHTHRQLLQILYTYY